MTARTSCEALILITERLIAGRIAASTTPQVRAWRTIQTFRAAPTSGESRLKGVLEVLRAIYPFGNQCFDLGRDGAIFALFGLGFKLLILEMITSLVASESQEWGGDSKSEHLFRKRLKIHGLLLFHQRGKRMYSS
jgi:hypothetical protein